MPFSPVLTTFNLNNGIMKRIEYQKGDVVGECTFIKDVPHKTYPNSRPCRKALFMCKCGNKFEAMISKVRSGHTKSCGCIKPSGRKPSGIVKPIPKYYGTWKGMKNRCYNKNNPLYNRYGGRGIIVCDEWKCDFYAFSEYITNLDNCGEAGMTLDRINNDGNYEPGNVRWATHKQQANNRGIRYNSLGYTGLSRQCRGGGIRVEIWEGKIRYCVGTFKTIEAAVEARNNFIIENNLDVKGIQEINK